MKKILLIIGFCCCFISTAKVYAQQCINLIVYPPPSPFFSNVISAGSLVPPMQADYLEVHQDANALQMFPGGPGLRLSHSDGKFGQLVLVDNQFNGMQLCNSILATNGDVLLRAGPTANDIVLSTQSTTAAIRFATSKSIPNEMELERMTILNDGNIGIGTTDPKSPLQVGPYLNL